MNSQDAKEKFLVASKLIFDETTSTEKFEEVRKLIKGINPQVDRLLESCSEAISKIEKLQKGDVIDLTAESLPEKTGEEKRRKKAILFFVKSWRDLQDEMERVRAEFEKGQGKSGKEKVESLGRITAQAKGPFGIITLVAVLIAGILIYTGGQKQNGMPQLSPSPNATQSPVASATVPITSPISKQKIKVITYNGKQIALSELLVATGPECTSSPREAPHYHAKDNTAARTLDGTMIPDPGGCGFGRVEEVQVEEIDAV